MAILCHCTITVTLCVHCTITFTLCVHCTITFTLCVHCTITVTLCVHCTITVTLCIHCTVFKGVRCMKPYSCSYRQIHVKRYLDKVPVLDEWAEQCIQYKCL